MADRRPTMPEYAQARCSELLERARAAEAHIRELNVLLGNAHELDGLLAIERDKRAAAEAELATLRAVGTAVVEAYVDCRARGSFAGFWTHVDDLSKALALEPCPVCEAPVLSPCGEYRMNAERVAYACRRPANHDGDHHPNPCGHDGCTGLECLLPGGDDASREGGR